MKVKDLMIGDWIHNNYTNENYQVWPAFFTQATNFGKRLDATFEDVNIEPIPLTPSILEKNGWVENLYSDESYVNEELECLPLVVGVDGNKWWWHVGAELVIPINYVHELQHALRLCGIEKEIVL